MEKQIEEMAKDLEYAIRVNSVWDVMAGGYVARDIPSITRDFANKGYRKASEVAREIFEEVHESIKAERFHHNNFGYLVYLEDIDRILAELKKKYTEGEE